MPPSSNAPAPKPRAKAMRPELESLVRRLAALPPGVRQEVISAAEATAQVEPVLPWAEFEQARAVISLGGNAVEDCDSLYDGA